MLERVEMVEANLTYSEELNDSTLFIFVHPQEELSRIYPNLFRLLWSSALPCSQDPSDPSKAHLLQQCSWQGQMVNCSDIFTPVITDSGVCCAFNMKDNLEPSNYSQLVREMQGKTTTTTERKISPGTGSGLHLILDQNSNRFLILLMYVQIAFLCDLQDKRWNSVHQPRWFPPVPWPALRVPVVEKQPHPAPTRTWALRSSVSQPCLH